MYVAEPLVRVSVVAGLALSTKRFTVPVGVPEPELGVTSMVMVSPVPTMGAFVAAERAVVEAVWVEPAGHAVRRWLKSIDPRPVAMS